MWVCEISPLVLDFESYAQEIEARKAEQDRRFWEALNAFKR